MDACHFDYITKSWKESHVSPKARIFLCFCFLLSYVVCSQNMAKLFSMRSPLWLGTLNPKPRNPLRKSSSTSESATKIMGAAMGGGGGGGGAPPECDAAPPNTKFVVVGLQNSGSHDHVSNGDRVWLNRRLSVQSLSARSSQQPTDELTDWLKASTVRPCSTSRSKNCSSKQAGKQSSRRKTEPSKTK
jgi:hypothetical protein